MGLCSKCGARHRRWRDKAHTKPAHHCAKCHAEAQKKYRRKLPYRLARKLCPRCSGVLLELFHGEPTSHRRNR